VSTEYLNPSVLVVSDTITLPVTTGKRKVVALGAGGAFTITLPATPDTTTEMDYDFVKGDDNAEVITITANTGQTINGEASATLVAIGDAYWLRFDGTNWHNRNPKRSIP